MSVSLLIDSTERKDVVDFQSLRRSNQINDKSDTLTFDILRGGNKTYTPEVGDEVILEIDGTREFGGVIVRVDEELESPKLIRYKVTCKDFVHVFDRQLVTENFTSGGDSSILTVEDIINEIVDNYTTGFTHVNVVCPIPVTSISFNRLTPSKCLQKLASKTNYHWFVDYNKDVHFKAKNDDLAPFNLTDDDDDSDYGKYIYMSLKQERDFSQIRNSILVQGGEKEGAERTLTYDGDDTSDEGVLDLPYKFSSLPTVTVDTGGGAVVQDVGIDFVDDDDDFDVMWNFNEKYLRWTSGNEPSSGDVIEVTGKPLFPIAVEVPDEDSINEFGVYEHAITDKTIKSDDEAIERAIAEIQAYGDSIVEGQFKTYNSGLRAGQRIHITDSFRNIDELVVIQEVNLRCVTPTGDRLEHNVKYATLKTIGILDFLQEQILDEEISEQELEQLLSLIRVTDDEANFTDTLDTPIKHSSPYTWGPSSPTWHTADNKQGSTTNDDVVIDRPDNVSEGNLIVVIFYDINDSEVISVPSGFSLAVEEGSGVGPKMYVYTKIATNSEPATYTFTQDDTSFAIWVSGRVTGYDTAKPIDQTNGENSGASNVTSLEIPEIDPTTENSLLIAARGTNGNAGTSNVPAGMTEIHLGISNALHVAEEELSSDSATGSREFTWNDARRVVGVMFNINSSNFNWNFGKWE